MLMADPLGCWADWWNRHRTEIDARETSLRDAAEDAFFAGWHMANRWAIEKGERIAPKST